MKKVYILSLGCSRNLVDSEILEGLLIDRGYAMASSPEQADFAVVNTCGFIRDAKEESIDMILELAELRKSGKIKKLIVTGCLSQRYPRELAKEIKEIDALFGTSDFTGIPSYLDGARPGKKVKKISANPRFLYDHSFRRNFLTPEHYAYLKIQEGCSNRCSYCVIPSLRGKLRSRDMGSILEEVRMIREKRDIKELIIVGQDVTSYGAERKNCPDISALLIQTSKLMPGGWVRLLYTHPAHFTDGLIRTIAGHENICKYVDLPIQHVNDRILGAMNRRCTGGDIRRLIDKVRENIKDVVIRTSVIVGFPGESDKEFRELVKFLEETRFERLGAFIYSREEGTKAARLPSQVPDEVKRERFDQVMQLQQEISRDNNLKCLNRKMRVLVDGRSESDPEAFLARTYMDAPEVDGEVIVKSPGVKPGRFIDVKIKGIMEYDLIGEKI